MKLHNNTILITGGSSGIGEELTERLWQTNTVLICGRDANKLRAVKERCPNIVTFQSDLSQPKECEKLIEFIGTQHPNCNIIMNNAATAHAINFKGDANAVNKASIEMQTNVMAPIILSKGLIPIIENNSNPMLINITSGLAYVPRAVYPFYNATKAALHSFTQVLRLQLKDSKIKVVEVLFPAVDTPWHKGNAPKIAIPVQQAVTEMIRNLEKEKLEIKVGKVKLLHLLSRIAPALALKKINAL